MPKIKIFSEKHVQQYGFTGGEIAALNAEWERKAAGLGLEEHLPEYWQEAKRHVSDKLAGRVAGSPAQSENNPLDGEPVELPSLDVNLDDFDIAGEDELPAVDLSDEELEVEFLSDDLAGLEPIAVDELELEVIPAGETVSFGEMAEEPVTVEGLTFAEEEAASELMITLEETAEEGKTSEESAPAEEPEFAEEEAAPEMAVAGEEWAAAEETAEGPGAAEELAAEKEEGVAGPAVAAQEMAVEEKQAEEPAPAEEPELEKEEAVQGQAIAGEERAEEIAAEEEPAPVAEQQKESFFRKIVARLKRMFQT